MKEGTPQSRKVKNVGSGQSANLVQSGNDNQATINHYHAAPVAPLSKEDELEELRLLREITTIQNRLILLYQQR